MATFFIKGGRLFLSNEINSTQIPIYDRVKNCAHTQQAWNAISEEVNSVVKTTDKYLQSDSVSQDEIHGLSTKLRELQKAMVDNLENEHVIDVNGDIWVNKNKEGITEETIDSIFNELQPMLSTNLQKKQDERIIEENTKIDLALNEHSTSDATVTKKGIFKRTTETSEDNSVSSNINGNITEGNKTVQEKIQEDLHKISDIAFNRKFDNTVELLGSNINDPEKCLENIKNGKIKDVLANTTFVEPANKEKFENRVKETFAKSIENKQSDIKNLDTDMLSCVKKSVLGGVISIAGLTALWVTAGMSAPVWPHLITGIGAFTFMGNASEIYDDKKAIKNNQEKIKTYEETLNKFDELTDNESVK